jgi:hypothetical protein
MPRVFCIDGVIIDITGGKVTKEALDSSMLMTLEDQPIMAAHLRDKCDLLTPMMGWQAIEEFGGIMLEDINTETFKEVTESLQERGEADPDVSTEWPQ